MATYKKVWSTREKKVKYDIQVKITDPITKAVKFHYTTWHNPENIQDGRRTLKDKSGPCYQAAVAYGVDWERKVREGGEPKTRFKDIPTFAQCADEHYQINENDYSDRHKIKVLAFTEKFKKEWGGWKMDEITSRDVELYFSGLSKQTYGELNARLKEKAKEILEKAAITYGIRNAERDNDFSKPTLYSARKGQIITWRSAEAISGKYGFKPQELFEKVYEPRLYKKETIKGYQKVLSPIFEYAVKNEWMKRNYATSKNLGKSLGGLKKSDIELLSEQERNRLVKVLDGLSKAEIANAIPIYIALHTGMRRAEICGLEWQDIDFENMRVSVKRNRLFIEKKGIVTKDPKTEKSQRQIPMTNQLFVKLTEYKEFYDQMSADDPNWNKDMILFCDYKGNPKNPDYINTLLRRYLVMADCHLVSLHKLRHGWITDLISRNVPPNVVSKLAGHASVEVTLGVYTHYCKEADNALKVLNEMYRKDEDSEIYKLAE
jgi:integrase